MTFAEASEGALADLHAAISSTAPADSASVPDTPTPAPAADPVAESPSTEADPAIVGDPSTPTADAELFTITHNGEHKQLSREELVNLAQQGFDYTAKSQRVAAERKALEADRAQQAQLQQAAQYAAQLEAQMQQLLGNPQALGLLAQRAMERQGLPAQPDEFVNAAQVAQSQAALADRLRADAQTTAATAARNAMLELQTYQFSERAAQQIDAAIDSAIKEHEILNDFGDPREMLRADANRRFQALRAEGQFVPLDQLPLLIKDAAAQRAAPILKRIKHHEQAAIARHAKAQVTSTEPPGGTAPASPRPPQPKLGSDEFVNSILSDLQAGAFGR